MKQPLSLAADQSEPAPAGYTRLTINNSYGVARNWAAAAISGLLAGSTLHDWAAAQPGHELMRGRGINYGVILTAASEAGGSTPVVVRRNRHGGLFGSISGDFFRPPTRAPIELSNSLRLSAAGVNTPEVIAYALYPACMNLVRCDVVTARLPAGGDLPDVWRGAPVSARKALLLAVAVLLRALAKAGAWHEDLNLKNIYIAGQSSAFTPFVLDVDRVSFPQAGNIAALNFNRLARSARKWRSKWGLDFDEGSIRELAALAGEIR